MGLRGFKWDSQSWSFMKSACQLNDALETKMTFTVKKIFSRLVITTFFLLSNQLK